MVDYIDGTLGASGQEMIARHIAACESCREELESLRTARTALDSVRRVQASERLWAAVLERIDAIEEERSPIWRLLTARPACAVAAGVLVLLVGAASLLISPSGQTPPLLAMLVSPFSPVGIGGA